jgi:hypothetical protein
MDAGGNRGWFAEDRQAAAVDRGDCEAHGRAGLAAVAGKHYEGGPMLTDAPPQKSNREQSLQSKRMKGWRIDWQGTNRLGNTYAAPA